MAFLRYVIGAAGLMLATTSIVSGASAARKRMLPSWTGALGCLVVTVISLTLVTVVSELLGSIRLFRVAPLTVALTGAGLGARFVARPSSRLPGEPTPPQPLVPAALSPRADVWALRIAAAAGLLVVSEWLTATVRSFQIGMTAVDATWYHMPTAARFAQSGSTWNLHVIDTSSLTVFYPAGSELFHAIGMAFLDTDALSRVLNLGWLALALLAAWCVGARYGVAPLTFLGASLLFATPQLVSLEAGQALNDVAVTALLLSAVAVIVNIGGSDAGRIPASTPLVVAAMAAGLAAGTKWTALISVAALTVGIPFLSQRAGRVKSAAVWLGVVTLSGSYWYLRNLVAAGSPVPPQRIGLGPIELPYAPPGITTFSLTHYFDADTWNHVIRPGLRASFGPLWWCVLLLAAAGLAAGAARRRDRGTRVAAVVGIACVASYVLTKQGFTIAFWPGTPRYAAPGLAVGLVLLPVALSRAWNRALPFALAAYSGVLVATQFDSRLWRTWWTGDRLAVVASLTAAVLVGLAIATCVTGRVRLPRLPARPIGIAALVGVALASGFALSGYRPTFASHGTPGERAASLLRSRHVRDARIALTGSLLISGSQYGFYDKRLTNDVQFIGERKPKHRVAEFSSCASFVHTVAAGRYEYVVVPAVPPTSSGPATWLQASGAARRLNRPGLGGAAVFEILRTPNPALCRSRA